MNTNTNTYMHKEGILVLFSLNDLVRQKATVTV